jgi:hypothetical protein
MAHTQAYMNALQNTARGTTLTAYTPHASLSKTKPDLAAGTATEPVYPTFARKPVTLGAPTIPVAGTNRVANTAQVDFDAKLTPQPDEEVGYATLYNALAAGTLFDAVPLPESGATLTVTAATNAGPIVLTIGTHALATGMFVRVAGVTGNTNANGDWQITVVNATQISLNGSIGNAAYVSGGTCRRFGFTIQDGGIPRIAVGVLFRDMLGGSV